MSKSSRKLPICCQATNDPVNKFAWWALFTPAGWEYYRWLDSFVEQISKAFSFEQFIADVGWHAALTTHVVQRSAAAQESTPASASQSLQPSSSVIVQRESSQS